MPADTSILMGFRPAQIESPDVQNARAAQMMHAQQQNLLAQMQLADKAREVQMNNALNDAYKKAYTAEGGLDTNVLRQNLATGGFGSKLPELEERLGKLDTEKLKRKEIQGKIDIQPFELSEKQSKAVGARLDQVRNLYKTLDPDDPNVATKYFDIHNSIHEDELLGPLLNKMGVNKQAAVVDINRAASTPGGMKDLITKSILGTDKFIEFTAPKPEKLDTGETIEFRDLNPNSPTFGKVVGPEPITKAMTPAQKELADYHRGLLANAKRRLNEETSTGKSITPQTLDFLAQVYAQTGKMPELGSGKNAANLKTAVLERAAQITMGGGVNAADAATTVLNNKAERAGELSGQRAVGTQIANIQVAANEATKMINIARPYVDKVNPSDYPTLNAVGNYVASKTGDSNITGLTTALNSLVNIYARAINPKGVATVSDKNHAREIINTAMAKGQINEAFKVMQAEMDAALASGPETKTAMRRPPSAVAPTGAVDKNNKWLK